MRSHVGTLNPNYGKRHPGKKGRARTGTVRDCACGCGRSFYAKPSLHRKFYSVECRSALARRSRR